MESPERCISNNTWWGEIDKPAGDENQRTGSVALTADTVWDPLPCILSGWGRRVTSLHLEQHSIKHPAL